MTYVDFDEMNLPVSSGQVESAVRRVVNLRFKAPGSFWKEDKVEQLTDGSLIFPLTY
jgi:tRNA U34 5-carboxymethylaminomethyl modifying GTPase MnmE/TrmE